VRINSSDPKAYPVIDPRYLSHEADIEVLAKIRLHLQKVGRTFPLAGLLEANGPTYQHRLLPPRRHEREGVCEKEEEEVHAVRGLSHRYLCDAAEK